MLGVAAAHHADPLFLDIRLEQPGDLVGRYQLIEIIGEGGFGVVWLAQQETPFRRRVALKILKLGMDTREVVSRFEAERQALARMDHPGIAMVLDAGATSTGRPYFVMELVAGVAITTYCDQHRLAPKERIALFISVCEAVQHAHHKGVIHRDLKPSNVLVSDCDGRPTPKVIDFGIAKAVEEPLTDRTLFTRFQQFIGTPAYMSPEQAGLDAQDIDTRSDVYSLGVLLYQLLTGRLPFEHDESPERHRDSWLRMIREKEPLRPSARFANTAAETRNAICTARRESAPQLENILRRDLDWITLKCLEKDRSRRYATANGLAADLRRFLNGEAVAAAPPSLSYRFRKLVRQHRATVGLAAAFLLMLCTTLVASTTQAIRATKHARTADQLRAAAETNATLLRHALYATDMTLASQALQHGEDESARLILEPYRDPSTTTLRGWDWRFHWRRATGEPTQTITGHTNIITGVAWSVPGRRLLSAAMDGTVREWDFRSGEELRRWTEKNENWSAVAVHPSGTNALITGQGRQAMLIDLTSGKHTLVPVSPGGPRYSVSSAPDGSGYVHCTGGSGFFSQNGRAFISPPDLSHMRELTNAGSRCAFSPDGRMLATGTWRGRIRLWSWPDLNPVGDLHPSPGITTLHFSPDGTHLVTGGDAGQLNLWNIPNRTLVAHAIVPGAETIGCARFSPDGITIATAGGDQSIGIWDARTLERSGEFRGHASSVWQVLWTPDGRNIINTTARTGMRIRDLHRPVFPRIDGLDHSRPLIFSRDGRYLAATFSGGKGSGVWDIDEARQIGHLTTTLDICGFTAQTNVVLHDPRARSLTFSTITNLDVSRTLPLENPKSSQQVGSAFALSPKGDFFARSTDRGALLVWDTTRGGLKFEGTAHDGRIANIAFSHDGRWMVSCGSDQLGRLWDAIQWREVRSFRGAKAPAHDIAISGDGTRIATSYVTGFSAVFDAATGNKVAEFRHAYQVAFPDDRDTLVTTTYNRLHFWHVPAVRESGSINLGTGAGSYLAHSQNGNKLATVTRDDVLRLFPAAP